MLKNVNIGEIEYQKSRYIVISKIFNVDIFHMFHILAYVNINILDLGYEIYHLLILKYMEYINIENFDITIYLDFQY